MVNSNITCAPLTISQCFSNDGRWIIAASMDSIIRIWDLPTGHLIDGIKTRSVVTTVAWSGKGDFLVTGHVDDVGVNLWYVLSFNLQDAY